jgi:hypothetical protein
MTNKEKANARANYNLVVAMQLLGIAPRTPPKPPKRPRAYSRASNTKKPRLPPGAWKGTTNNIGESFLKSDGTKLTITEQKASNLQRQLKKLEKRKTETSQVNLGGKVNIQLRRKAFEGNKNKNKNPNNGALSRGKPLSLNKFLPFDGASAFKLIQLPHQTRNGNGRVRLTVR